MRIASTSKIEIIFRPDPDGPALLVLKVDDYKSEFEFNVVEVLQLVQALGIGPAIAGLVSKFLPG